MASRLSRVHVDRASGFSLNVSNFISNQDNITYGKKISSLLNGAHFVIDTSRNGAGSAPGDVWCNPSGRALGPVPTMATNIDKVDAFLWIKNPTESDGNCNGGPNAGVFWQEYAIELARNAKW